MAIFLDGCEQDNRSWACQGIGLMIEEDAYGDFDAEDKAWGAPLVRTDDQEAVRKGEGFLNTGCDAGIAEACYQAGRHGIFDDNPLGKITQGEAGYYLRQGCDRDHAEACYLLGESYRKGRMRKTREGIGWALVDKACALGHETSCLILGIDGAKALSEVTRSTWIDPWLPSEQQIALAMRAADNGEPRKAAHTIGLLMEEQHPEAEWVLGNWFLTGKPGVVDTPNEDNAVILIDNAARVGHIEAAMWMGLAHWAGDRVEHNRDLAWNYMSIAAREGDTMALQYRQAMINEVRMEREAERRRIAAEEARARQNDFWYRFSAKVAAMSAASASSGPSSAYSDRLAAQSWQRHQSAMDNLHFQQRYDYLTGVTTACNSSNPYC